MPYEDALRTKLQRGMPKDVRLKRMAMIDEALSWPSGTLESPVKHSLDPLPNGTEVYFLKPGKEAGEGDRNPNDMLPVIGTPDVKPTFLNVWGDLTKVSIKDFEAFRMVLLLIYRSAYLLDHMPEGSSYRYRPNARIVECINDIEGRVGNELHFGLWGLLRFIDVLGWNEDVKYHSDAGKATFDAGSYAGKPKVGRQNTLLTCIRVPYETARLLREYREVTLAGGSMDFVPLYSMMQGFINSGGVCLPKQEDLAKWLSPYIFQEGRVSWH